MFRRFDIAVLTVFDRLRSSALKHWREPSDLLSVLLVGLAPALLRDYFQVL